MGNLMIQLLLFATVAVGTTAFLAPKVHSSAYASSTEIQSNHRYGSSRTLLSLSSSPDSNGNGGDLFPKARTDVRNFLTQRSIQSFVYLLNQCREEHTVRWLEKTLDFTSIDNFHGTGAFNQTKFPEWDSVFLDCVDRPEEVIVVEMRQQRRQQKLSGHNDYFESLKSSTSTARGTTEEDGTKSESANRAFSTTNYLDAMKPKTNPITSTPKKTDVPKTTSRKLSGSKNYLDNLSSSPPTAASSPLSPENKEDPKKTNEKGSTLKDCGEKESPTIINSAEKPTKKAVQRRTFAPGKSSSYLESLSTISNSSSLCNGNSDGPEAKTKQSTELSKNPFLEEKTKEYELSIDPPALVRRILSVRELLAKEWAEDLDMLIKLNDEITESFEEYNNKAAIKDDDDEEDEEDNLKTDFIERTAEDNDDAESLSDIDALIKSLVTPVGNDGVDPDKNTGKDNSEEKCENVFDRSLISTWSQSLWSPKRSSSPYRKANFDLLLLLATQESIHRVLYSYKSDKNIRPETYEWLLDYYTDNVNKYFDGHQTYARSEEFLEEMLKSPRTLIETNSEILAWVDPAIVAEDIVRERSEVTLNWMRIAENILDEHTDLRRLLFTNMVSKSFPEEPLSDTIFTAVNITTVKNEAGEDSTSSATEVFGAFE